MKSISVEKAYRTIVRYVQRRRKLHKKWERAIDEVLSFEDEYDNVIKNRLIVYHCKRCGKVVKVPMVDFCGMNKAAMLAMTYVCDGCLDDDSG